MRRFSVLFTLSLAAVISACASVPENQKFKNQVQPAVKPDRALVYIYRQKMSWGSLVDTDIYDNDEKIGTISNGGYLYFYAQPGPNNLRVAVVGNNSIPYVIECVVGQTYHLKSIFIDGILIGDVSLKPVTYEQAASEMVDLGFVGQGADSPQASMTAN